MNLHHILATAALSACLAAPAGATVVQGSITGANSFTAYMGDITLATVSGNDTLPDTAFAFCIVGWAHWPGEGKTRQYTLTDSFAPFMRQPAAVDKVTGLLHYVIDYYYAPLLAGLYGADAGYGFNEAIWQLTDADGTRNSVAVEANDEDTDPRGTYALYAAIMGDLYAHYDSIAPDYRSDRYDIRFLKESDDTYQSLAIVSDKAANEVPEPSSLALLFASGLAVFAARRRQQA